MCPDCIPGKGGSDLWQQQGLEGTGEKGSVLQRVCLLMPLGKAKYARKFKKIKKK